MNFSFKNDFGAIKACGIIPYKTNLITGELFFLLQKKKNGIVEDFGGKIEKNIDNSPVETAIREFKEETNNNDTKIFDMELIKKKINFNNKNNEIYIPSSKYLVILINYNNQNNINLEKFSKKETHTGIIRDVIWVNFWDLYKTLNKSLDGLKYYPNDYIKINYRLIDTNFKNRITDIKRQTDNKKRYILKKWNGKYSCILLNYNKIIDFNLKKNNNDLFNVYDRLQNILNNNDSNKLFHKNILKKKDVKDFFNKKIEMNKFNLPLESSFVFDDIKCNCSINRVKWEYKTFLITILVSYKISNVEKLNNRLNNFCISPVNI